MIRDILISLGSLALSVLSFAFVAFNPATRCPVTQCGEDSHSAFYMTEVASTPELPKFLQEAFGEDVLVKTRKCQNFGEPISRAKCSMKVANVLSIPANLGQTCSAFATDPRMSNVSSKCNSWDLVIDKSQVESSIVIDFDLAPCNPNGPFLR